MTSSFDIKTIFQPEQLAVLDKLRTPKHIAFIPDGNRRWAKKQQSTVAHGHEAGASNLLDIVLAAKELDVKIVTFYIFSTENWQRDKEEVAFFLWLIESWLIDQRQTMIDEGVRLQSIGDPSRFPKSLQDALQGTKEATAACDCIQMVIALNYGGRDEIRRAVKKISADCKNGILDPEEVTEATISRYLDTAPWKDPDLLIRTSGESRISNFLIWQISYTEVYFADMMWPDFTPKNLLDAVSDFQNRQRRWGGA